MKLLSLFFSLISFIITGEIAAQQPLPKPEPIKVTFYYNAVWELTTQENALYRREAYFDLTEMTFDGVYSDYNSSNKLIADGNYSHGSKTGIHSEYKNDTVKRKVEYDGNDFTIWEWRGKESDVKNGTGIFSTPYFYFMSQDGQIIPKEGIVTGEFLRGRRAGRWIYRDLNKFKTDEEIYTNGKLIKRTRYTKRDSALLKEKKPIYLSLNSLNTEALAFDKQAFAYLNQYFQRYITYPATFNRSITYPGGLKRLLTLFAQAMMIPEGNMEMLRLRIDETGRVEKAAIVRSINLTYDDLTDQILKRHKDRFFPAIKNGKPVPTTFYMPIAGGDDWMDTLADMPTEWFLDPSHFMN